MRVGTAKELGDSVRAARRRRGLTQQDLASRAGVSRQWVAGLEHGKVNPSWDVVVRLTTVLGIEMQFLDRAAAGESTTAPAHADRARHVDLDAILAAHRDEQ